jgi:hypothetical protein
MDLPVNPPLLPMLAKRVDELPPGDDWIFEPKWDGFRALIFRDKDEIFIQSRDEKPLNRQPVSSLPCRERRLRAPPEFARQNFRNHNLWHNLLPEDPAWRTSAVCLMEKESAKSTLPTLKTRDRRR